MNRRLSLKSLLAILLLSGASTYAFAAKPVIEVFKDENCSCCKAWIKHLQANGFAVKANNVADTSAYRKKLHMPEAMGSCHTATVDGYTIEGHVPAGDIRRLLKERPQAVGLAVPGMPLGSPGMEGPRKLAYDVLLVKSDGKQSVYHHYAGD